MIRSRASTGKPEKGYGNGSSSRADDGYGKLSNKKLPDLSAVVWLVVSVVLIFLFLSMIIDSHDDHFLQANGSRSPRHMKNNGYVVLERNYQLPRGFGKGKKKTPCPEQFKRTFWMDDKKINQPVARALRMRGWLKTDKDEEAQVIWTYVSAHDWYQELKPWQRYNHIPKYKLWNQKDSFVTYMMKYAEESGKPLKSIPETYRLDTTSGMNKFRKRLFEEGGLDTPWVLKKTDVNQGRGITMLGPNSKALKTVFETVKEDEGEQNYIIQRYVCNEMTINNRKFDFRVFWIVASLDPLIIMYHDGYLRIGNAEYNENDWSSTTAHLTTMNAEGKGTWDDFGGFLRDAAKTNKKLRKIRDPLLHVENQVKQVLGEMGAAFKKATFNANKISAENGFGFFCADFIIDWDLDVFFIEPQHGCGIDEDHQFRVDMHNSLFTGMIDVTEAIWERQERGLSLKNKFLEQLSNYEVVYNDGWMYEYKGYRHVKNKKGCEISDKKK